MHIGNLVSARTQRCTLRFRVVTRRVQHSFQTKIPTIRLIINLRSTQSEKSVASCQASDLSYAHLWYT